MTRRWLVAMLLLAGGNVFAEPPTGANPPTEDLDQRLLRLSRRFPGFAGLAIGPNRDELVILVQRGHPVDAKEVRAALAELLGPASALPQRTRVASVKYGFLQLSTWRKEIEGAVAVRSGFAWSDVAEDERNRVRIGVSDAGLVATIRSIASSAGIPSDAYEVVVEEGATLFGGEPAAAEGGAPGDR